MNLQLSKTFALPLEAATRRMAILAMSGAGKSNNAVVMAEEMYSAGIPWVAIDPKGDWYGVRSDKTGKRAGLPIPVFGGLHGDVPLEPTAGKLMGELIAEKRLTCVLDVSEFETRQDLFRFLYDLATTLLRKNKTPLHLFLEEADEYLPQNPSDKGFGPMCLGAWQRLVKRGRFRGMGVTMITQRSTAINKDVVSMAEALFAMRMTWPDDKKRVTEWMKSNGVSDIPVDGLSQLQDGEAYFSSPQWLKTTKLIRPRQRRTFDSGKTPEVGGLVEPAKFADIDLSSIKDQIAATIEKAKADDPAELRKEIAELRKQLATREKEKSAVIRDESAIVDAVQEATSPLIRKIDWLELLIGEGRDIAQRLSEVFSRSAGPVPSATIVRPPSPPQAPPPVVAPKEQVEPSADFTLKPKQQQIIDALNWWESIGITPNGVQLGAVALIDTSGGYFSNLVGPLVTNGYVTRSSGKCRLTEAGKLLANKLPSTPTLSAYHDMLRARIRSLKSSNGKTLAIFDLMVEIGGQIISTEEVGTRIGIDHSGGYFSNSIGPLSTLELITRNSGVVQGTPLLFPEGLK